MLTLQAKCGSIHIKKPVSLLALAIWFGLLGGVGEILFLAVDKYLLHRITHRFETLIWMIPLAYVLWGVAAGLILIVLHRWWPKRITVRVSLFVLIWMLVIGVLLRFPVIHPWALVLVAMGIAWQGARVLSLHEAGLHRLVKKTIVWLGVVVMAIGLGLPCLQWVAPQRVLASLPQADPDAPNVLLIVMDTVRSENLSVYGYHRSTTPQMEQLAKRGVVFDWAISTAPWTLPSHASMFTGRYHYEMSADWLTPLDGADATLAEVLSDRGYMTGGFVANLEYCSSATGLARGFSHYEDYPVLLSDLVAHGPLGRLIVSRDWGCELFGESRAGVRKSAQEINHAFLGWLDQDAVEGRPFFAFLNYYDAHDPYVPPKPYDTEFATRSPADPTLEMGYDYSDEEVQAMQDAYDGGIGYMDDQIGQLLDELKRRGTLDNTLVIITSDHGEQFKEHGIMGHGNSLYMPSVHVPLLICLPDRVAAGKRITEAVTLRDLGATIMDLTGFDGSPQPLPGSSLSRFWQDSNTIDDKVSASPVLSEVHYVANNPSRYPVSQGDMKSVVARGYQYIVQGNGVEQLYDLGLDPWAKNDLGMTEASQVILPPMVDALQQATTDSEAGPR